MRNVNLNILKFLRSINNFYLSLSKIGLEVSYQLSVISSLRKLPTPYTPHPTPYTPHPTPHFLISFSNDCHRFFQSNK
ncbi:hypothetical protein C789_148 [Microcystis aeruginosa FACHB-905 = DIANCHI905]|uniref:Uncharacterized protein n=1 Tax=Microcystis aeruginosa PCC 7806SL TaxID=1903187 RepID=A0AB33C054_MICA7|nr:hypothetical protein BH695_4899 [Microcystis aeruginosa PCC 7806SL]ELS50013.1 hypothetical protein C789_148 [Microcystis aeruginosa FACHB-905 = DIANCHI905]TRU02361.1 MAG: hypothetical protein EWV61_11060 [Microcystis aeruginosa Ma_AC_P_19900807_S300]